jgi:Ca-activated chloride channel family protein
MGGILATVFPNLPRKLALIAGAFGGGIGAILGYFVVGPLFGAPVGVAMADALKGVFLGTMLTVTEKIQLISEASLTIHWAKNETSRILLGKEPIRLGSDTTCQIYLRNNLTPEIPVVAEFVFDNGRIVLHDKRNGRESDLVDGTTINVGGLRIEVKAAQSKRTKSL